MWYSLNHESLSFEWMPFGKYGLSLLLSFLFSFSLFLGEQLSTHCFIYLDTCPFFLSCPLAWIFSFFSIAHIFLLGIWNFGEREKYHVKLNGVIIWWIEKCMLCVTLGVRVGSFIFGCTCVTIMGASQESQLRSQ
jgi:hypothetical protein